MATVIDVPLNVNLDIWAEIRRLEADRARLVVDWGNGNNEITGCGACRLENKYLAAGRYTVTAKVVDLNTPSGNAPILSVTVTLIGWLMGPGCANGPVAHVHLSSDGDT